MRNSSLLIILLFLAGIESLSAQIPYESIDSLRNLFRTGTPIEAYNYYHKSSQNFDYKALYYDEEMKRYLLTWVDTNEYISFKRNYWIQYLNDLSEKGKLSLIKDYIQRKLKLNFDSIAQSPDSLMDYQIQAINFNAESLLKDRNGNWKTDFLPPTDVFYLHARIAYPESYKIIKWLWYKYNKEIIVEHYGKISDLFIPLLIMNDPKAQAAMDKIIKEMLRSSEKDESKWKSLHTCLLQVGNGYAIKKLIEILPIQMQVAGMTDISGTWYEPLDHSTYQRIKWLFVMNNADPDCIVGDVEENRKNKKTIVAAAEELIKRLEEESKYWMENIPYDYLPKIEIKQNE